MTTNAVQYSLCLILIGSCLLLGMSGAEAARKNKHALRNPLGCKNVGHQFELKALHLLPESVGERTSLYFILNKLNKPINLYQMRSGDSARSMHLNHVIHSKKWAVLSTSAKDLKYICTINHPKLPYGKIIDCADGIRVCEYTRVKFGLNNRGDHWLVKSNSRNGAVRAVVRYGIIPR